MSILLRNNPHAPAPWHIKRGGAHHDPTYTLVDAAGTPLAQIILPTSAEGARSMPATLRLLENAPKLLAAVMEYALHMDAATGGITQELADLIILCGGKDLNSRVRVIQPTESWKDTDQ